MALFGASLRQAHADPANKPQALNLEWGDLYLRTEVQFEQEHQSVGSPATAFAHTRTILEPAVGIGLAGSVYHPNLVQFHLNTEIGLSWEDTQVNPGGASSSTKFLQRYNGALDFLNQKPYATSVYGDKDMTYRDYDFFSRVRVDSEEAGVRTGYSAGPVPFSLGVQHYEETEENARRPRNFRQDTLTVSAQNRRARFNGSTRLAYNVTDFTRRDDGFNTTRGVSQNLNLTDNEQFGARKQAQLTSLLNYSALIETAVPTDQLLAQEDLRLQHTRPLDSFYTYLFNASSAGNSDADTHHVRAGVNYQWQPDLTTSLDGLGDITHSASPGSSLETKSYGAGFNTQYTPTLSSWARLSVNDDAHWNYEDRQAAGLTENIISETHALTDGSVVLLTQPGVIAGTIHVWEDTAHTIAYFEGVDYQVVSHGTFVEIRRVPGGTIPNGAVVYVDYSAALQGSASYDTLANTASFRLDFWNGLFGLYSHWAILAYEGGETLLLRRLDDKTIGVDAAWRWFRAGAEYETVDSNLAPYDRTRFLASAHFQPGNKTDMSLNADAGWTDFIDSHLRQTSYGFIARLQQQLNARMSGGGEGGVRIERGESFDRDLLTCRLWLNWVVGKTTIKVTYEFNDESHQSDRQDRHYVFVRIRRDFR